jgi:Family of unknown function (DUF6585)
MMSRNLFSKNTSNLSAEIHHMAKKEELGELCKVYPAHTGSLTLGLLFFTVPLALLGLYLYQDTVLTRLALVAPAFILLMIGLYIDLSRRCYRWNISLWQYGFIYEHERKQIRQAFRWNRIESVQADISNAGRGISYRCKVCRQDGYEFTLGDAFSNIPVEFIDRVLEESACHLAPQEVSVASPENAWTSTTTTHLDRQGVGNGQETLPWQKIQYIMAKNGAVALHKKDE